MCIYKYKILITMCASKQNEKGMNINMEENEMKAEPVKNNYSEWLAEFEKAVNSFEEIPIELKISMIKNMYDGVEEIVFKKLDNVDGYYSALFKSVEINADLKLKEDRLKAIIFHELMHSATTPRNELGQHKRDGFKEHSGKGTGLNEGATEFFSHKLYKNYYNSKNEAVSYAILVDITRDMISLYGEQAYLDAYINGPEKLDVLMQKDGKSFYEFRDITDDFYEYVYMNKEKSSSEILKNDSQVKEKYKMIGKYIEEIKKARGLKPHQSPNNWKNAMYMYMNLNAFSWFKDFFSNIREKFSFKKKTLLLEEETKKDVKEEFRKSLNKENFNSESDNLPISKDNIIKRTKLRNFEKEER